MQHNAQRRSPALLALIVGVLGGSTAQAAPFPSYDPVSLSMGGTGVALPDLNSGTLLNPAALAALPEDRRWAVGTHAGARLFDPEEFFDALDDFQDEELVDGLDGSIREVEESSTQQQLDDNLQGLATALEDLDAGIANVAGRPVAAEAGAGFALNRADSGLGVGVHAGGWGAVSATSAFRDRFLAEAAVEIIDCRDRLNNGQECSEAEGGFQYIEATANNAEIFIDTDEDIESDARVRGIGVREYGLTLARQFRLGSRAWATGITLKSQEIDTFDYVADIEIADADDIDEDDFRESHSDFNIDLGMSTALADAWRVGATVRNAISRSYETALGNEIDLDPQVRAGAAYDGGWFRLSGDADLAENDPIGFEDGTQFVGIGGEIDIVGWIQLRAGYRADLVDSVRNTTSVGIGLSPFRTLRLNLGAAGNDDELGGAFQLGVTF